MNEYTLDSIKIGTEEQFSVTVTEDMRKAFLEITGDVNPMHTDKTYAKQYGYGRGYLFHGMLTASFLSTLVGVYLPGRRCLFHECSVQFTKPVYAGDTLAVSGKVTEIDLRFRRISIKAQIMNQRGEKVLRGKLIVGVLDDVQCVGC